MNAIANINAFTLTAASVLADRAALLRAVDTVTLAVERKNTYPILANVRLRGDGQTLFLTGTNLDVMIDVAVGAAADPHLDMTVNAHVLRDLLKGAPKSADMVSLTMNEPARKVRSNREYYIDEESGEEAWRMVEEVYFETEPGLAVDFDAVKFELAGIASDAFPDLVGPKAKNIDGEARADYRRFTMDGADLLGALSTTQFAISNEETRYYLNGIYMHVIETPRHCIGGTVDNPIYSDGNRTMRLVATDGHRLGRQELPAPEGSEGMAGAIIHKGTVDVLLKLLKPVKGAAPAPVTVEVDTRMIRFGFRDITVTAKLVEGTFPDYDRVTPKNNDREATVNVAAMQEAIKAVSMIASDKGGKVVKLYFDNTSGKLELSVTNFEQGRATSTVAFEGGGAMPDAFEIGFNARYLSDLLAEAKADGDDATMVFNDSGSPALVRGGREGWLGVLMPMRV